MITCIENMIMTLKLFVSGKREKTREGALKTRLSCVGTIEIVLILVVLIGLVLIFKNQIRDLLSGVFTEINAQSTEVY